MVVASTRARHTPVHLLVVVHGLWGAPQHVAYICESAARHHPFKHDFEVAQATAGGIGKTSSSAGIDEAAPNDGQADNSADDQIKLEVISPSTNSDDRTYDGIDHCAERVVVEIDAECQRIKQEGGKVVRFSIVGYSLGGLIARYALGLLDSRTPSFFADVKPVNFTTFASPAIGIPRYDSVWSSIIRFLGARLLSRSGSQLYENDRYLVPSALSKGDGRRNDPSSRSRVPGIIQRLTKGKEKAEPLLAVMADPRYSFFKALSEFEKIDVYANTVNDRTVPFPTGAIEAHDPFAHARAKAQKVADARDDDPTVPIDLRDGGMDIQTAEDAAILLSWDPIVAAPGTDVPTKHQKKSRRRWAPRLPLLLRPTTYPFSRPVSLAIIVTLPVSLPIALLLLIGRFVLQTHSSGRRIRHMRKTAGGGRQGMLERVGVGLREVAETVGASGDNPEYAAGLDSRPSPSPSASRQSSSRAQTLVEGVRVQDWNENEDETDEVDAAELRKQLKTHPAFQALSAPYDGTGTPPLSRPFGPPPPASSSTPSSSDHDDNDDETRLASASDRNKSKNKNPDQSQRRASKTDPILSPAQEIMIANLNSIPHLKKHFVYLPQSRNAHGAIVARDPVRFAQHLPGKKIVDHWAREFKL